jgi:hypothetical protein
MAKLTTKERKALPASDFAGGKGHYPIPDASHARNALSAVHRKYPGMGHSKAAKTLYPGK